jgi:hypothetical protein
MLVCPSLLDGTRNATRTGAGPHVNRSTEVTRREAETKNAIEAYIAVHPQAMDTLEGIIEWWLTGQRAESEIVVRVLEQLVRQGLLEDVVTGHRKLYRLKRRA